MSLIFTPFSVIPPVYVSQLRISNLDVNRNSLSYPSLIFVDCKTSKEIPSSSNNIYPLRKKPRNTRSFIARERINSTDALLGEDSSISYNLGDGTQGEIEDLESPWEGAVVYQRNPTISHIEFCTTLERLGLGELSTDISKSRASVMGLRVTKAVKDFPLGTPVLISADVTRKKKKLRLDGIVRTVMTLACNRCGEPAAESVFSNFSLLLTEEPIEELEIINMGVIFGEDKYKTSGSSEEEEDDEASIDLDDRLYFPPEEKAVDISKQIRDLIHVEITINSVCNPMCKGLCLKCGSNLNTSTCNCSKQVRQEKGYGPLKGLKEQMQKY